MKTKEKAKLLDELFKNDGFIFVCNSDPDGSNAWWSLRVDIVEKHQPKLVAKLREYFKEIDNG